MICKTYHTKSGKPIRLWHGDCIDLMNTEKSWDLAIVDPPYNIESQQKRGVGSRIDESGKMNGWNNKTPTKKYFDTLFDKSKNQIVWGANNFVMPPSEYFLIWNKHQTVDNFASAEYAWVSMGLKMPAKVFDMTIHSHNNSIDRIHPTQKPVRLYRWILSKYTNMGDTILDTHGGSMSLAIACYIEDYELDIIELDEDYYNDAVKRFEQHISQKTLF